jgi:hypothetical protein
MIDLTIHLRFIGALLLVLALVHIDFPRRFGWHTELKLLSLINRQMIQVHTFFIALVVGLNGLLLLFYAEDLLLPSRLAGAIAGGLLIFWGLRFVFQLFVYDAKLWRGKRFETIMHLVFTLFWTYSLTIYVLVLLRQLA